MPLISCTDCGREVSTRARFCVHCGNPTPVRRCSVICALMTGALVAVMALGGMAVARVACHRAKMRNADCFMTQPCQAPQAKPVSTKLPTVPEPASQKESPKEY